MTQYKSPKAEERDLLALKQKYSNAVFNRRLLGKRSQLPDGYYEVAAIFKHRKRRVHGGGFAPYEYKLRWAGWKPDGDSWQTAVDMNNFCRSLLERYNRRVSIIEIEDHESESDTSSADDNDNSQALSPLVIQYPEIFSIE